jgi:MFS family permease
LRRILIAYTVNRLGTWFGLLALLVAVYDHTHSALAVASLLFAGQALPAFVVPAVVARVEASQRRGELTALYVFEALATASIAVLLSSFWLPAVLLLAALDGTAALAARALLRAEIARVARDSIEAGPDDRTTPNDTDRAQDAERNANAALNVAFSATFVLGPVLGGAVVAAAGAPAGLFINVGAFLIGGVLLADLHPHVEEAGGDSVRVRLRAAWTHINQEPTLRKLLLAEAAALVFVESGGPIEVTYVKATLHAGDRGLGLVLTAWGAGAILGSLVFARLLRRPLRAILSAGTVAFGLGYIGFAAAPSLTLACLAALIGGLGNGLQWPSLISLVQRLTPPNLHGRLMGAVESIAALCLAIGLLLGGALVALSSPRVAFLVVGVGALVTTAAFLTLLPRETPSAALDDSEGSPAVPDRNELGGAPSGELTPHAPAARSGSART